MTREELQRSLQGAIVLAPLTKGGNLPFRRLCVEFGAQITVSEMAYTRNLLKGDKRELALLRRHPSEKIFGVQIASRKQDDAVEAGKLIQDSGADFIDINCGCPIHDTTRRGLGAMLLQRPKLIGQLVEALTQELEIPVTVKIRSGWSEKKINAARVAQIAEEAGAAAVTLHGRTRQQRYTKPADWELISQIRAERGIPIIGNGDIVSCYEAADHFEQKRADALMLARGALIKPWLFAEIEQGSSLELSPQDRIEIYYRFTQYLKEHFGSDDIGRKRIMGFLPWHFSLFCRYEYISEERFQARSTTPLLHERSSGPTSTEPLQPLLASRNKSVHQQIATHLFESSSLAEASERLLALSEKIEEFDDEASEVAALIANG